MPEVIRTILTADSGQLRAEFARASAALGTYQQQQQAGSARSLAAIQAELAALKLQATGFPALAASMREQTALRQQAAQLAASANITERQAIAILQERLQLHHSILASAPTYRLIELGAEALAKTKNTTPAAVLDSITCDDDVISLILLGQLENNKEHNERQ